MLAREDVLRGLVLHETTTGLVHGHLRQHEVLVQRGHGGLRHDVVDLLLVELLKLGKGLQALLHEGIDLSLGLGLPLFRARLGGSLGLLRFCHESSSICRCKCVFWNLPPQWRTSVGLFNIALFVVAWVTI